jgi:hypothetical protein
MVRLTACLSLLAVLTTAHYHADEPYSTQALVDALEKGHYGTFDGVPDDFECSWRLAAMAHAKTLQPFLPTDKQKSLFDALELGTSGSEGHHKHKSCKKQRFEDVAWEPEFFAHSSQAEEHWDRVVSVSSTDELLSALGEVGSTNSDVKTKITMAPGTYRLNQTMELGPDHSGTTIAPAKAGDEVILSGSRLLSGLTWAKTGNPKSNIYVTPLPLPPHSHQQHVWPDVTALRINGMRATRARFPNANPEWDQFPKGYVLDKTDWKRPEYKGATANLTVKLAGAYPTVDTPASAAPTHYGPYCFEGAYRLGTGGSCSILTPPQSYWCQPDGRVADTKYHPRTPAGISNITKHLPHSPYKDGGKDMVLTYWRPGHWFSIMYNMSAPGVCARALLLLCLLLCLLLLLL